MIVNFIEVSQNPPKFSSSRFRVEKNTLELHGNRRERDSASFFIEYVVLLMIFVFFTLFSLVPEPPGSLGTRTRRLWGHRI